MCLRRDFNISSFHLHPTGSSPSFSFLLSSFLFLPSLSLRSLFLLPPSDYFLSPPPPFCFFFSFQSSSPSPLLPFPPFSLLLPPSILYIPPSLSSQPSYSPSLSLATSFPFPTSLIPPSLNPLRHVPPHIFQSPYSKTLAADHLLGAGKSA